MAPPGNQSSSLGLESREQERGMRDKAGKISILRSVL